MQRHLLYILLCFPLLVWAQSEPIVYSSAAQTPSSVEENDSVTLTYWNDTVYTVKCRTITKVVRDPSYKPSRKKKEVPYKGHHILFGVGGGYADLGYRMQEDGKAVGSEHGSFGGIVQLQYGYFFTENWGLGVGLGFSHYTSYGTLNVTKRFEGQTDSDGERYTHIATAENWKERQAAYLLDVPIEVLCHYPLNPTTGIYAGLGVKAGLIFAADRCFKDGAVVHSGEYNKWGLTLTEVDSHDFYREPAAAFKGDDSELKYKQDLQLPAIGVMADFGFTFKLTEQINLLLGVYGNYTCNNVRSNTTTELGWRQRVYKDELAYRNHEFMNFYGGELTSEYVKSVRPWEVGIKIGIDWRHKPKQKPAPKQYVKELICDTTVSLSQRVDTVYKPKPVAVQKIERLMETSVIWFDFDSSEPNLKPADILDKMAEILKAHPEQRILIHGHASKEGTALHNKQLSESRAKAIYDMLLERGVNAEQMTARGFGVDKSYQEDEHEIALDRRVEIIPVNE